MEQRYEYIDRDGTFRLEHPERTSGLYFPLAGEAGLKSCVTPNLGGDSKLDQNAFLLQPVSVEDLHNNRSTRSFWLILEGRGVWSATGGSAESEAARGTPREDEVTLEAGLLWQTVLRRSMVYGVSAHVTSFVPPDPGAPEIMEVTVKNESDGALTVTPIAAIPLYCRGADRLRDHRHVTSLLHRARVVPGGVEVTPTLSFDERGHSENRRTYYVYGADGDGAPAREYCADASAFLGEGGSFARPLAVYGDADVWTGPGAAVSGCEAVGALRFETVRLAPGGERTWTVLMGITDKDRAAQCRQELLALYAGGEKCRAALERTRAYWREKVNVRYESGDPDRDCLMRWVTFQPILRRIFGCSFLPYHDYGKGGRGWRDLWQDCIALLLMAPEGVREKLIDYCAGIRMDGTNATIIGYRQGEFIADRNDILRVWMDHGFWPFQTIALYIHQTGDLGILLEEAGYFKDKLICRGERTDMLWREEQGVRQRDGAGREIVGSVLEHVLIENVTAFFDVGEHNHIRLRGADWNDALDMAPHRGESVAFTAAYAGNLAELADVTERLAATTPTLMLHSVLLPLLAAPEEVFDDPARKTELLRAYGESCAHAVPGGKEPVSLRDLSAHLRAMADWIRAHIRATEWQSTPEGSFFNGYYDDNGRRLEGVVEGVTRMGLTAQVFPVMFGTASDGQVRDIIRSADRLLCREEIGGYRLNTDYGEVPAMGRAFSFAYGHKENGAVFSHMSVMYANALYRRGFVREGRRVLDALCRQAGSFEKSRCYPGIPEYFSDRGRGMYPYLTGSASWLMLTAVTQQYGVRGLWGDLEIAPKLLREQLNADRRCALSVSFAGVALRVSFLARAEAPIYTDVAELTLNGERVEGTVIPRARLVGCGEKAEITVIL